MTTIVICAAFYDKLIIQKFQSFFKVLRDCVIPGFATEVNIGLNFFKKRFDYELIMKNT